MRHWVLVALVSMFTLIVGGAVAWPRHSECKQAAIAAGGCLDNDPQ